MTIIEIIQEVYGRVVNREDRIIEKTVAGISPRFIRILIDSRSPVPMEIANNSTLYAQEM
jgi:hypothetical protein